LKSINNPEFEFCAISRQSETVFTCLLDKINKWQPYEICLKKKDFSLPNVNKVKVQRQLKQPYIVIPTPQRMCNQNWNYNKKWDDWECLCSEGKEQSPIDLPSLQDAVSSPVKPYFEYDVVNVTKENLLKIEHDQHRLVIKANTSDLLKARWFGKLVTNDWTVYYATEIAFHSPSEHTINWKKFPLEIQVLHEGKSKGDFSKKAILSFLYEWHPGVYNKFLDDVEFFNLPNPHDKYRVLHNKIFVPNMLRTIEDPQNSMMIPFSFYTYQGSLTLPPCVENVIHLVASQPIPASITSLDMFKESLRMPDFEDSAWNLKLSPEKALDNARKTQDLNWRTVFAFDKDQYSSPLFAVKEDPNSIPKEWGHYEKQEQSVTNYIFVEGTDPSWLPWSLVVPESEAK